MRQLVTVTVDDAHAGALHAVARRLSEIGFDVDQVLGAVGVITGSVDAAGLPLVEGVEGVAGVELQRGVQLAPPDSDVQ